VYRSTVSYASIVKGLKMQQAEDNVSTMTEQSTDKSKDVEEKKRNESKQHEHQLNKDNNSYSDNDQSSMWLKESVINQIKNLSEELNKERKEREIEKQERLKEKEENKVVIENLM